MKGIFHIVFWRHAICGVQFWEIGGDTLDDTMRGQSHMG